MNLILSVLSMISILPIISSISFDPNTISGRWYQPYSNRYVQRTLEISYNCVTVDVSISGEQIHVNKTAYDANHHIISYNYTLFPLKPTPQELQEEKDNWALALPYQSDLPDNSHFRLREIGNDYLLWSQNIEDGQGLYVWARDFLDFKTDDEWVVLARYNYWNFTEYYDLPIKSYDYICLTDPFPPVS